MNKIKIFPAWILLFALFVLSGCSAQTLSHQDYAFLQMMQKYESDNAGENRSIFHDLIKGTPTRLANEAAENGDFKLVALAMGYHAGEDDASVFGVRCAKPVETHNIVFGCVPPPPVVFKLMKSYNVALIQHPEFPQDKGCEIDDSVDPHIRRMERMFLTR